jgi:aldehyde dehydrogenase (NAD+)
VQTDSLFIGGSWRPATDPGRHAVTTAAFSEPLYSVPEASPAEIEAAVDAATAAAGPWGETPAEERAAALMRIKAATLGRLDDIAQTWAREAGMPVESARAATAALPISAMDSYARIAVEFETDQPLGNSRLLYQPAGVAVGITPWNYPFSQVAIKAVTAIAAGCPIIIKPATLAPGCAYLFAEIVETAGLPDGVFNLITGSGSRVGEALVAHPGTKVISFTGSTNTGVRILRAAADGIKRCTLELGGKSPLIVLPDSPLDEAIVNGMGSCFRNNGQTCTALTRFLVPRSEMGRAAELAQAFAEASVLGDPLDPATTMGPMVSSGQWESVQRFIQTGIDEGATLVTGGAGHPEGFEGGNFVRPTVFVDVSSEAIIAREEIFGPVLAIVGYDSVDEAVRIANDSEYGLAAAVWGQDPEAAAHVGRRIDAGVISINGAPFNAEAPYGGLGRSGLGHELGEYGYREYLDVKVLNA